MKRSTTCVGIESGKPLVEYGSLAEAEEGVRYVTQRWGKATTPYRCGGCGRWHLCPVDRQTPSRACPFCTGHTGQPKQSYESRGAARRRAVILRRERGVVLRIYACEHGCGFHLTSDLAGGWG